MKIIKEEEFRRGRIVYGHICTLDSGELIYLARRKHREIFRQGRSSISGAMTEGMAAWAIDESTLFSMRARGITRIGVRVTDTGDLYMTELKEYFDPKKSHIRDYTGIGRGGSKQRVLGLQHFEFTRGRAELPVA